MTKKMATIIRWIKSSNKKIIVKMLHQISEEKLVIIILDSLIIIMKMHHLKAIIVSWNKSSTKNSKNVTS